MNEWTTVQSNHRCFWKHSIQFAWFTSSCCLTEFDPTVLCEQSLNLRYIAIHFFSFLFFSFHFFSFHFISWIDYDSVKCRNSRFQQSPMLLFIHLKFIPISIGLETHWNTLNQKNLLLNFEINYHSINCWNFRFNPFLSLFRHFPCPLRFLFIFIFILSLLQHSLSLDSFRSSSWIPVFGLPVGSDQTAFDSFQIFFSSWLYLDFILTLSWLYLDFIVLVFHLVHCFHFVCFSCSSRVCSSHTLFWVPVSRVCFESLHRYPMPIPWFQFILSLPYNQVFSCSREFVR
jgi:hypothetical protein